MPKDFTEIPEQIVQVDLVDNTRIVAIEETSPSVWRTVTFKISLLIAKIKASFVASDITDATATGIAAMTAADDAALATAAGLGTGDDATFATVTVAPADAGGWDEPTLKLGLHKTGLRPLGDWGLSLVVNNVLVGMLDRRGETGAAFEGFGTVRGNRLGIGNHTSDTYLSRASASVVAVDGTTPGDLGDLSCRNLILPALAEYTVGTLPSAASFARARAEVTDAASPAVGSTVTGGGAVRAQVRSNGTNWIVIDTFTAPYSPRIALTYAGTLTPNCDDGLSRSVAMTGNQVINAPTNGVDGMVLKLKMLASGGARQLTFNAAIKMPTGSTYEPTVASGSTRMIELEYNGTAWMLIKNLEFVA